jgi:hypothetical protein
MQSDNSGCGEASIENNGSRTMQGEALETGMDSRKSLELISEMIRKSQEDMKHGSMRPFFIWGYTTIGVSLLVWLLLRLTGNPAMLWFWWLIPVIGWTLTMIMNKKDPRAHVKSYVGKCVGSVWLVMCAACVVMVLSLNLFLPGTTHYFAGKSVFVPILFIVCLTMGCGTAMTGLMINSKVLSISGFIGLVGSMAFMYLHGLTSILAFAGAFAIMMVIPAHIQAAIYRHSK